MSVEHLDELIEKLNGGDLAAAEQAFLAYEPYLRMAIRRQLNGPLRSKLDTMDIVQSVWADVLGGFREAGWRFNDPLPPPRLPDQGGAEPADRPPPPAPSGDRAGAAAATRPSTCPAPRQPRPSEIAQEHELWKRILDECSPGHREILILKRQGLPNAEIARRTGLHEGSVRRILYELARRLSIPRRASAGPAIADDRED